MDLNLESRTVTWLGSLCLYIVTTPSAESHSTPNIQVRALREYGLPIILASSCLPFLPPSLHPGVRGAMTRSAPHSRFLFVAKYRCGPGAIFCARSDLRSAAYAAVARLRMCSGTKRSLYATSVAR